MAGEAYLILENGTVFEGRYFGAKADITGEIVFTTGMTGYLETLTDNSYYGQIILQTFPLIGNYGVIPPDFESDTVGANAYIVRSWCREPSNFRSEGSLDTFLLSRNIPGMYGIDTRALTRIIRENGVMNGMITGKDPRDERTGTVPSNITDTIRAYRIRDAVASVSSKTVKLYKSKASRYNVVLFDYGSKENIKRMLIERGCNVYTVPHNFNLRRIRELGLEHRSRLGPEPENGLKPELENEFGLELKHWHELKPWLPDGIMLSNGPGDPADNADIITNLREIMDTGIPVFGICLGHQLMALASGFMTHKLKYGHRGANQPVKDLLSGKVYITSQNHGYAVTTESIDTTVAYRYFENVNDKTCEGLIYRNCPAFSVQFHPEACGGPRETAFLFDRFIQSMEDARIGVQNKCLAI